MTGVHPNILRDRDGVQFARPSRRERRGWVVSNKLRATPRGARIAPSYRVAAKSRAYGVAALARSTKYGRRAAPCNHRLLTRNAGHGGY